MVWISLGGDAPMSSQLPKSPVVQLSDDELETINEEGRKRDEMHPDSRNWKIPREMTNVRGLKGEFAFAKYYDLEVDTDLRPDGDGGIDFVVEINGNEKTVDVKTVNYPNNPLLLVREAREDHPDMYVLTATDSPEVKLVGMLPTDHVLARDPVESQYGHLNHRFEEDELLPLPPKDAVTQAE